MKKLGVIMIALSFVFCSLYAFPEGCIAVKENGAGEGLAIESSQDWAYFIV